MQTRPKKHKIAESIFLRLPGAWFFDRFKDSNKIAHGIASFTHKTKNSLYYKENGKLYTNTCSHLNFSREYIYCLTEGKVCIFFGEENKACDLFLSLNIINDRASGQHICNSDTYSAVFKFQLPNRFSITYKIIGPTKNYSLTTIYNR